MKLGPTQFENICRQEFRYASNDEIVTDRKENIVEKAKKLVTNIYLFFL